MDAATILAPQYARRLPDGVKGMDWVSTEDEAENNDLSRQKHWVDEKDFEAVALAISRGNPKRAGVAISR